jgi:hypothetical protein
LLRDNKLGMTSAVTVPVFEFLIYRYKTVSYELTDFSVSCKLHERPSGILHFAGTGERFRGVKRGG